jgi:hypothetical protein
VKTEPQILRDGPNQLRPVGQKDLSCRGYILRSNKQGLIWKQVCSCCPRPAAHRYYPLELWAAAKEIRLDLRKKINHEAGNASIQ